MKAIDVRPGMMFYPQQGPRFSQLIISTITDNDSVTFTVLSSSCETVQSRVVTFALSRYDRHVYSPTTWTQVS